jgi:hypothetical protein
MRRLPTAVILLFLLPSPAGAQGTEPASQFREHVGIGPVANLALEGSGLWFAPGIRLGVPLTTRTSLDVESSAVFGGKLPAPYGSITSFLAVNARRLRSERRSDGTARYWIFGLRYTPIRWPPEKEEPHDDLALTLGYGWDQVFASRWRVGTEIGVSGGNGFLLFTTIAVSMPLHR